MSNLYTPDIHINEHQEQILQKLSEFFSGTVIFAKKTELEQSDASTLLENIIKKGLKIDATELLVVEHSDLSGGLRLNNLNSFLEVDHIISFGISPEKFGLNITAKHFVVVNIDGKQLLFVPSLLEIGKSQQLKSNLWSGLKEMYNL